MYFQLSIIHMTIRHCRWEMCGQVKVVVKIESEDDMLVLQVSMLHLYGNIISY